eukprot:scaffold136477_cov21-Tisochrysis_lutea.AAC.1
MGLLRTTYQSCSDAVVNACTCSSSLRLCCAASHREPTVVDACVQFVLTLDALSPLMLCARVPAPDSSRHTLIASLTLLVLTPSLSYVRDLHAPRLPFTPLCITVPPTCHRSLITPLM